MKSIARIIIGIVGLALAEAGATGSPMQVEPGLH